jgi:hypothetical protein
MRESEAPTRKTIEAVWRIEAARLIGGLARSCGVFEALSPSGALAEPDRIG